MSYTEEQTAYNSYETLYYGRYERMGQRLTISNRSITKLSFPLYLAEGGSPTGDIYFRIRKVSDDSIINSKLLGDASIITESVVWYEVTFDTPVNVNEEVYILVEYSGGDYDNKIALAYQTSDVKASEYFTEWDSITKYDDKAAWDCAYIYTFEIIGLLRQDTNTLLVNDGITLLVQ